MDNFFHKVQETITRLRWIIGASIPVLIAVNEIWNIMSGHMVNQIVATLASLGLLSSGAVKPRSEATGKVEQAVIEK